MSRYPVSSGGGSSYTNEEAQDAVGTILVDTSTIDFTYDDATPQITADVKDGSVTYAKLQDVSATSRVLGRITAGAGDAEELTAANVKTILSLAQADITGLTTADSPQFAGLNVGHASDTTITRTGAGDIAVEGNAVYRAGGTDVPLADGGTGASLADPNADRIMFWDDSAGAVTWLTAGSGLTITDTTMTASGSGDDATGKQTMWISADMMKPTSTSGATPGGMETTTNDVAYNYLSFSGTAINRATFPFAFPKQWNEGTVTFKVYWQASSSTTNAVVWGLQGMSIGDNETTDTAWGTAAEVTDTGQSAADELYISDESGAITIAGTPAAEDLCFFRFYRDPTNVADTYTSAAELIGIKLYWTNDVATDD